MPEKKTIERAHEDAREGKAPTTQAGEFVQRRFITCGRESTVCVRPSRRLRLDYLRPGAPA